MRALDEAVSKNRRRATRLATMRTVVRYNRLARKRLPTHNSSVGKVIMAACECSQGG